MNTLAKSLTLTSLLLTTALSASAALAAPTGKPDLIPMTKAFGNGKISVKNIGKAKSRTSWLTIKCLSSNCPEHPGMNAYKNNKFPDAVAIKVPALKAGASFSHQLAFWNQLEFEPGQHKFLILADAGKDIPESNELNNKAVHVKKVSKPIGSFTSKVTPAKSKSGMKASGQRLAQTIKPNHSTANNFAAGPLKADLIIKPYYQSNASPEGFPGQSFCEQSLSGGASKNIWFFVKNTGDAAAKPSQVRVLFNTFIGSGASGVHNQKIPMLAKGESKVVKVALPKGCYPAGFNTSCHFRIVADSTYQVKEKNESNNHVDSKCVGPAG